MNCKVEWCDSTVKAKGLCNRHYLQNKNGGIKRYTFLDSNQVVNCDDFIEVVLRDRAGDETARVKIDYDDSIEVQKYKWHLHHAGYPCNQDGKTLSAVIMGGYADHKNRDPLDCRRGNLRLCTHAENCRNRGAMSTSGTGVRGVTYRKSRGTYNAYVFVDGTRYDGGSHKNIEDATQARHRLAIKHHGEFANVS